MRVAGEVSPAGGRIHQEREGWLGGKSAVSAWLDTADILKNTATKAHIQQESREQNFGSPSPMQSSSRSRFFCRPKPSTRVR